MQSSQCCTTSVEGSGQTYAQSCQKRRKISAETCPSAGSWRRGLEDLAKLAEEYRGQSVLPQSAWKAIFAKLVSASFADGVVLPASSLYSVCASTSSCSGEPWVGFDALPQSQIEALLLFVGPNSRANTVLGSGLMQSTLDLEDIHELVHMAVDTSTCFIISVDTISALLYSLGKLVISRDLTQEDISIVGCCIHDTVALLEMRYRCEAMSAKISPRATAIQSASIADVISQVRDSSLFSSPKFKQAFMVSIIPAVRDLKLFPPATDFALDEIQSHLMHLFTGKRPVVRTDGPFLPLPMLKQAPVEILSVLAFCEFISSLAVGDTVKLSDLLVLAAEGSGLIWRAISFSLMLCAIDAQTNIRATVVENICTHSTVVRRPSMFPRLYCGPEAWTFSASRKYFHGTPESVTVWLLSKFTC